MADLYAGTRVVLANNPHGDDDDPLYGTIAEPTTAEQAVGVETAGDDLEVMAFIAWDPGLRRFEYVDDIRPV